MVLNEEVRSVELVYAGQNVDVTENMTTQYIKPSATTRTWTIKKGSSTVVTFKVVASGSESCYSTGMIKQDK